MKESMVIEEGVTSPRTLLPNLLNPEVKEKTFLLTSGQELNDASWSAWYGSIQEALRQKIWKGWPFHHCHVDLSTCQWADPLPFMSLALSLTEFEQAGGSVSLAFASLEHKELSMEKLYKRIQERAFIILNLLLSSVQKAISYLQKEIPRLIKNCMKSHQRSRRSTLEIIEYGPCQIGRTVMIKVA